MKKQNFNKQKPILFIVLISIIVIVSVLLVMNAFQLKDVASDVTTVYVKNTSVQMAQNIDNRLFEIEKYLNTMADSLSHMNNLESQIKYLKSKLDISGFTLLGISDLEGSVYFSDETADSIKNTDAFLKSVNGYIGISVLDDQSILYSVPVKKDTDIKGILVGILNKENIQAMIKNNGFEVSCLVDHDLNVVVSPTDFEFFHKLDEVFQKNDDNNLIQDINMMKENIKNCRDGIFEFTAVNGEKVLMAYNSLEIYHWSLLTIIPEDFVFSKVTSNIMLNFLIVIIIICTFVLIIISILSTMRKHNRRMENIIYTDLLTGGINRAGFYEKAREILNNSDDASYCIVTLNVQSFKIINVKYGRAEGDNVLNYIYKELKKNTSEDELVSRVEADNFVLLLRENNPRHLQNRLKIIIDEINSFNYNNKVPHIINFFQGAYLIEDKKTEIRDMVDRANIARSNNLENTENCSFYDETLILKLEKEQGLINSLDSSLKNGDFEVYFQPKVKIGENKIGGAEALVRWQHPDYGLLSPLDFIPLFEKNGLITKIDLFVFEQVCSFLNKRIQNEERVFIISVNVSRYNLKHINFLKDYEVIKNQYEIPDNMIELEFTESIIFDDTEIAYVKNLINEIHRIGFLCSLDDFGYGYSSLSLLNEFSIDTVKLDRSFFVNKDDTRSQYVIETMVNLCKKFNITTVAEGIESLDQLSFLNKIGCDMVQGYVFSKPLPVAKFENWIIEKDV